MPAQICTEMLRLAESVAAIESDQAFPHEPWVADEPLSAGELVTHRLYFNGHHFAEPQVWPELELDPKRVARLSARFSNFAKRTPRQQAADAKQIADRKFMRTPRIWRAKPKTIPIPRQRINPFLLATDLSWYLVSQGAEVMRKQNGWLVIYFYHRPNLLPLVQETIQRIERNSHSREEAERVCRLATATLENWFLPRVVLDYPETA